MLRGTRAMAVVAALALGAGAASASRHATLHWLGRSFAGLALSDRDGISVFYGDCTPGPDAGCALPIEVQSWSICRRNPLEIDVVPRAIRRQRGVPVVDYGDRFEVLTGSTDAVIFANRRRIARDAVGVVRPDRTAAVGRLAHARLPRWVLRQLVLVRAHADEPQMLGISRAAIQMRLRLADALGKGALRGIAPATITPGEVNKDRSAWLGAREGFPGGPEQQRRARRHAARIKAC